MSVYDAASGTWPSTNDVVCVLSSAQLRIMSVTSMRTVSATFAWIVVRPVRTWASGDFAPRSVNTGKPRISNESAGEGGTGAPGVGGGGWRRAPLVRG